MRMAMSPITINRFSAIPIKISITFFTELKTTSLKFKWRQSTLNNQIHAEDKKNNTRNITISVFKLYCGDTVTKTTLYGQKNKQENQWNRIENPEINLDSYSHVIHGKVPKTYAGRQTF
jgi:hypothetical protein